MAALGAVVQHFISFPGSPCCAVFVLKKLCICSQYFALSEDMARTSFCPTISIGTIASC